MSSIRLFILGALEMEGDMHGHQLRQIAEKEHIDEWTDITVGSLYGTIKRLAAEKLIEEVRVEREGAYPERQVWTITELGRASLDALRRASLSEIVVRPDPFDLAMSRLDVELIDELPATLDARIADLRVLLTAAEAKNASIQKYLSLTEKYVMTHRMAHLRADIEWHEELARRLPQIVTDELSRKDNPS